MLFHMTYFLGCAINHAIGKFRQWYLDKNDLVEEVSQDDNSCETTVQSSENLTFSSVPEVSTNPDGKVQSKDEKGDAAANNLTSENVGDFASVSEENSNLDVGVSVNVEKVNCETRANSLTLKMSESVGDFASVSDEDNNAEKGLSAKVQKVSSEKTVKPFKFKVSERIPDFSYASDEDNNQDIRVRAKVKKVSVEKTAKPFKFKVSERIPDFSYASDEDNNQDIGVRAKVKKVSIEKTAKPFKFKVSERIPDFSYASDEDNNQDIGVSTKVKKVSVEKTAKPFKFKVSERILDFSYVSEENINLDVQANSTVEKVKSETTTEALTMNTFDIVDFVIDICIENIKLARKLESKHLSAELKTTKLKKFEDLFIAFVQNFKERSTLENEHGRMMTSEDASTSACPDLAQNENATADETGTNNEQISHGTHQDSRQNEMTLEDKINGKSGDDADFEKTLNNQANCNLDPTVSFCKFSNSFNNCWMNATMHSILNLSITRKYLTQNPEKVFGALSGTPLCATFLCTALNNPGKYFCPDEIYQVLIELSRTIPSLALGQPNDITEFLEAILIWLHPCGINSLCKVKNVITCEDCAVVRTVISELGPVIYLSDAQPNETTASLLERFVFVEWSQSQCCNTSSFCKKYVDSSPDVISLYLHRYTNEEDNRLPVIPSATLHIPLESGTQLYRLSSVICCKILNAATNHFYTYVVGRKRVFKADGTEIKIAGRSGADDMNRLGFIYIYEKYS